MFLLGHRCSANGCGSVLVVDGNMKNHCSVCAATEAGYVQYAGLHGTVKTGCTNTPCQKSRFCKLHKPRALSGEREKPHSVIEMILEKRTTRNQTLYKVNFTKLILNIIFVAAWCMAILKYFHAFTFHNKRIGRYLLRPHE